MSDVVEGRAVVYRVDAQDRLVFVSESWSEFAYENGAPELGREQVLQRSLWELMRGIESEEIYRALLNKVRATGRTITLPFRCDSPGLRRFMQIQLRPKAAGEVEFFARVLRQEARPAVQWKKRRDGLGDAFVRACSWCKRMQVSESTWVELEAAVEALGLFEMPRPPMMTHGMCDDCCRMVEADLNAL